MSQKHRIYRELLKGTRITPLDALRRYGCFRLAARIYDLRSTGVKIETHELQLDNGARVAEYYMPAEERHRRKSKERHRSM